MKMSIEISSRSTNEFLCCACLAFYPLTTLVLFSSLLCCSRDQELGQCRLLQSEMEMRAGALSRQLERKEAENVTLSADKEALSQQLGEAIRAKLTAMMQLDDLASREEAFANR